MYFLIAVLNCGCCSTSSEAEVEEEGARPSSTGVVALNGWHLASRERGPRQPESSARQEMFLRIQEGAWLENPWLNEHFG
jgi:hypothetical protein